jgi:ABC-type sugar transport system ATPase subunit
MNFIPGRVVRVADGEFDLECDGLGPLTLPREGRVLQSGQFVSFGVRPEDLRLADEGDNAWPLVVDVIEQHGSSTFLHCNAPSGVLLHVPAERPAGGDPARAAGPGDWHVFGADYWRI